MKEELDAAPKRNVINVKKVIQSHAEHRVSQQYINEVSDIVESIIWQMVDWSDNAADVTENGTLLISHVPFYLTDRKNAIDRAIQNYYDKVDNKEERRREREAKNSSKKFKELMDKDDKLREEE